MILPILNTKLNTWPPEPIDPGKPFKGMTRRVVTHYGKTPEQYGRDKFYKLVDELNGKQGLFAGFYKDSDVFMYEGEQHTDAIYFKARYQPGDILYVQETWKAVFAERFEILIEYRTDGSRQWVRFIPERFAKFRKFSLKNGWQSPYFMPKEAARLFLTVKDVPVERLQDITAADAVTEGATEILLKPGHPLEEKTFERGTWDEKDQCRYAGAVDAFATLWDYLSGKKYPWASNPYVWVITFERTERPVTP